MMKKQVQTEFLQHVSSSRSPWGYDAEKNCIFVYQMYLNTLSPEFTEILRKLMEGDILEASEVLQILWLCEALEDVIPQDLLDKAIDSLPRLKSIASSSGGGNGTNSVEFDSTTPV